MNVMRTLVASALTVSLLACSSNTDDLGPDDNDAATGELRVVTETVAEFSSPWAMTFLSDGRLLVTEKYSGQLWIVTTAGEKRQITGVPAVDDGGQGGLGDVVLHPDFATNDWVYLSYVEAGSSGTRGAVVDRAKLTLDGEGGGALSELERIWTQTPKVSGRGHFGHRIAFSPDGYLFISSGERQKFDPAQDMNGNLGKIVRLHDDGRLPDDNPFASEGGVTAQIWSLGHRNPLGLAFDAEGNLWNTEMGPQGGDELNFVVKGENYGYPEVSNGDHYGGADIPDHSPGDGFKAPAASWYPSISPAGFVIYRGDMFPEWKGSALIGGLSSRALIRFPLQGDTVRQVQALDDNARIRADGLDTRIREVEEAPDGAVWVLQDGGDLLRLTAER